MKQVDEKRFFEINAEINRIERDILSLQALYRTRTNVTSEYTKSYNAALAKLARKLEELNEERARLIN